MKESQCVKYKFLFFFPQMVATILVLYIVKKLKVIDFPDFSPDIVGKIWPLPLMYVGNLIFGLGGTKRLR